MSKIKLSSVGDCGSPTGFATVMHNVMGYLQDTGEYDINILGINFDGRPNQWSKQFNIWPARIGGDFLGVGAIQDFIEQTQPDVTFLFQDFFNIPLYLGELPEDMPGVTCYYPVDAPNVKGSYLLALGGTVELACYTDFAVEESIRGMKEGWNKLMNDAAKQGLDVLDFFTLQAMGGVDPITGANIGNGSIKVYARRIHQLTKKQAFNVIPHGTDLASFHQLDKNKCREKLNIKQDIFLVGSINRNQPRKRLDLAIRAFAKFAKDKPNAYLLLHSVKNDSGGWDLSQLAAYYGVYDRIIPSHRLFKDKTATIEELNEVYNALDVQINTSGGEGWGLPSFEGAASYIPQVVPDWSATKEIWTDSAELIKIVSVSHNTSSINLMHCVIDCDDLCDILNKFYEDKEYRIKVGEACYQVTQRPEYKWEAVGKQFDAMFKRAVGKTPIQGPIGILKKKIRRPGHTAKGKAIR